MNNSECEKFIRDYIHAYDHKDWEKVRSFFNEYVRVFQSRKQKETIVSSNAFIAKRKIIFENSSTTHALTNFKSNSGSIYCTCSCDFTMVQYKQDQTIFEVEGQIIFEIVKQEDWKINRIERSITSVENKKSLIQKLFQSTERLLVCIPEE